MPDFRAYVRRHLPPLDVSGEREAEIVEELALELEQHYERAIRSGVDPSSAWTQQTQRIRWNELASEFRLLFGDTGPALSAYEKRKFTIASNLLQDVRYGLRLLAKSPGFTLTAVLTIAVGIGPNSAIFSVLYSVFWAPTGNPAGTWARVSLNDDLAGYPERVDVQSFTPGHITMLGGRTIFGRDILPKEGIEGDHRVVVISSQFWHRRYSGDPNILGNHIRLDGVPHKIVGVLEPGWWDRQREPLWPALAVNLLLSDV